MTEEKKYVPNTEQMESLVSSLVEHDVNTEISQAQIVSLWEMAHQIALNTLPDQQDLEDPEGMHLYPRSRRIIQLISAALLTEVAKLLDKEIEIREQLKVFLAEGNPAAPQHKSVERQIQQGNLTRLSQLREWKCKGRTTTPNVSGFDSPSWTHQLAHLNMPKGMEIVCPYCPSAALSCNLVDLLDDWLRQPDNILEVEVNP